MYRISELAKLIGSNRSIAGGNIKETSQKSSCVEGLAQAEYW